MCSLEQSGNWGSWSEWSFCNFEREMVRNRVCKKYRHCNVCTGISEEKKECSNNRMKRSPEEYVGVLDEEDSRKWAVEIIYQYGTHIFLTTICPLKGLFTCNDVELRKDIYKPILEDLFEVQLFWVAYVCYRSKHGCPKIANRIIWSGWSTWSKCSSARGRGIRVRERYGKCAPSMDQVCDNIFETVPCMSRSVSNEGVWSQWSSWHECKSICGESFTTRSRSCLDEQGSITRSKKCPGNHTQYSCFISC